MSMVKNAGLIDQAASKMRDKTHKVERHAEPGEVDEPAEGVEPPVLEPPPPQHEDEEEHEGEEEDGDDEAAHPHQDVVPRLGLVQGLVVLLAEEMITG